LTENTRKDKGIVEKQRLTGVKNSATSRALEIMFLCGAFLISPVLLLVADPGIKPPL